MKRFISYIMCLLDVTLMFTSCTEDELMKQSVIGKETWVSFDFGHQSFDEVEINARATLDIVPESRVLNMFVYVFTQDGQRIYSHYFDKDNKKDDANTVTSSDANCWYVNTTTTGKTTGTVRIKAPQVTEAILYLVANLDEDMMNVSSERLNTVRTLDELEGLTVDLKQHTASRNGYFPMTAKVTGVTITQTEIQAATAYLERLDAKVTVNIALADTGTTLKAFIPDVCRVVNLPGGSMVANVSNDYEEAGYFTCDVNFDEQGTDDEGNITTASCSFYMLENRESSHKKDTVLSYHNRDLRIKNADGSYNTTNGLWLKAPENATYLEIHGELQMEVNTSTTGIQELIGDVIYYVHLGDFGEDINDYDVKRNTHYTYNITIYGVDKIRVEVENDKEEQSGATGHVYSSTETQYTFDAHYGQRVFSFNADEVGLEAMTFYVKTPFGREGTPETANGYDVSDLDYQWVKFLVNKMDTSSTSSYSYSHYNRIYPGDNSEMLIKEGSEERLMNVAELLAYVKEEKEKYDTWKANGYEGSNPCAFLKEGDEYRLYVTAFVNEYYYETHPTDQQSISWKEFVNQPNRLMHILCQTQVSKDGASSVTGSVITIRQRSIQTPYNLNKEGLTSAFGCEIVDETRDAGLGFYEDGYTTTDHGNYSTENGLYNTACLWELFNLSESDGSKTATSYRDTTVRWDTYLNYEQPNDNENFFMKSDKTCMRYAPMTRNRDNNGNGYIDPEEVRWYIAPLEQLYALYIGELGINSEAQLYPSYLASLDSAKVNGVYPWRNHIVCSNQTTVANTQYVNKYWPDLLWAEEGVSLSGYGKDNGWGKPAPYSIRCTRNLGMDDATSTTIINNKQNIPTPIINVTNSGNVYRFDLSNVNDKSVRFYTTHELIPSNEYAESSRIYYGFETYTGFTTSDSYDYNTLKANLEAGESPCPDGYRIPNVREAALMSVFCPASWWNGYNILSCNYYSHGEWGTKYDTNNGIITTTWIFGCKYVSLSGSANRLIPVRDWNPNE